MSDETLLQIAFEFFKKGWSVIPVGRDKKPLLNWKEYQKRRAGCDEITEWFNTYPDMQLGIVTGEISNLTVVDMEEGADFNLIKDETFTVKTGGNGRHFYFTYNNNFTNAVRVLEKTDIRSEGGYVVAPGSSSHKGGYEILKNLPITTMSEATFELLTAIKKNKKSKSLPELVGLNEGGRNSSMASLAGKLMRATNPSKWDKEVWPALVSVNSSYNPPLDKDELLAIYNSISNSESNRIEEEEKLKSNPDEESIKHGYKKDATKATYALAKFLIDKYKIITVGEKDREIYAYKDGKYSRAEESIILPEIQRILGDETKKVAKTETLHKITDQTYADRSVFESSDKRYIPVKNGVYDLVKKTLLPHSSDFKFLHQFPVVYDETAKCSNILNFITQVLQPSDVPILQEYIGFMFYRKYTFKKAVILVGERDTGKTTLLSIITSLIGKENTSGLSLQKISSDRFATASLFAKHVNVLDDLSSDDIKNVGQFKMAVGGGFISAEYKYGNAFMFQSYSKLIFACNRIPEIRETDDLAFYSRWLVIPFLNKVQKKIQNMEELLCTESEMSGLFNWAMEGLTRLLNNGEFSDTKTADDIKIIMMMNASSIARFVANRVEKCKDGEITKDALYDSYSAFCEENNLPTATKDLVGKTFSRYAGFASDGQSGNYGRGMVRVWRGIKLKDTPFEITSDLIADKEFEEI